MERKNISLSWAPSTIPKTGPNQEIPGTIRFQPKDPPQINSDFSCPISLQRKIAF